MAWIREIDASDDEALKELFDRARDPRSGEVDNILSVHSLHPRGMAAHLELYRTVMTGSGTLPKVERELIAFVVSRLNDCHY